MSDPDSCSSTPDASVRIAVVIPCFNEAAAVHATVTEMAAALPGAEVHVFDNASTDDTAGIARSAGAIVHHVSERGKGNVVRRMFADVEADLYVMVDGDATYEAAAAPVLVELALTHGLDMVVGERITAPSTDGEEYRSGHVLGNKVFTGLYRRLFGTDYNDVFSGYRVMTRRFVKSFPAMTTGFDIETELIVHAADLQVGVGERPTAYVARPDGSESKLSTYQDGWRILRSAMRLYRDSSPSRFYGYLAVLTTVLAWALGIPVILDFLDTGEVARYPTAFLAASIQVMALTLLTAGIIIAAVRRANREQRRLVYLSHPAPPGFGRVAPTDA